MIYVIYGLGNKDIKKVLKSIEANILINYEESNIDEIINEASYDNLFGDKKIVLVKNSSFLTGKSTLESISLNNYIEHPNPNTILIFSVDSEKLDERKKIVKLLREKAQVLEIKPIDIKEVNSYVKDYFNERNYKVEYNAINEIANRINDNTNLLDNELEKLVLYKIDDKTITIDDVKKVVIKYDSNDKIFKLVEAALKKDKVTTFKLYKELINGREEPAVIISLIASQIRLILQVGILNRDGFSEKEIATKLKEHPYRVKLALESFRKTNKMELINNLEELSNLDYKIKKGDIDKVRGLETYLLSI